MVKLSVSQTNWNLKLLFDNDDDPGMGTQRQEIEKASYEFINKWKDRDDYLHDPTILKQALDEYEEWEKKYGTSGAEGYYWSLRSAQEQSNAQIKAKINQITDFSTKIYNDIQFFCLRIAKVPVDRQQAFLGSPELQTYRHFLELLFAESKYLLSEPEEKILNLKAVTSHSNWVRMTDEFLAKSQRMVLNEDKSKSKKGFSDLFNLIDSRQKEVRDSAAKALNDVFRELLSVAEIEINSVMQNKKIDDELREMSRPDLGRHLSDDIDTVVVDTLVETVSARFDIAKKYYQLKAKLMGIPKLEYHERNVPYGKLDKPFPYEDSVNLVFEALNSLDSEFGDIFSTYVTQGQIDAYPRKDKSDGAFCTSSLIQHPTYILLNYGNKLRDVLTLAHETGHGVNNELIKASQHALHFGTPISTAEVASTFMEDFVLEELIKEESDEIKLAAMMMKLNQDISAIFRQIAFYKFETELHRQFRAKGYLPKEAIGSIFQQQMAAYMGEGVEQSPGAENWWMYVGHFRKFFYVYSYASGVLISKSLQASVKEDHSFVTQVKEFLAAGRSDSPKNIFAKLGIDITDADFWRRGLSEVDTLLQDTEALARNLGKIA